MVSMMKDQLVDRHKFCNDLSACATRTANLSLTGMNLEPFKFRYAGRNSFREGNAFGTKSPGPITYFNIHPFEITILCK